MRLTIISSSRYFPLLFHLEKKKTSQPNLITRYFFASKLVMTQYRRIRDFNPGKRNT